MSERVPSVGAVVALQTENRRTEQPLDCPLCLLDALAKRTVSNDAAILAYRHAIHMVFCGIPIAWAAQCALAVWSCNPPEPYETPADARLAVLRAHFWAHGGSVALMAQSMMGARETLRFLLENMIVNPQAMDQDDPRVAARASFLPGFLKSLGNVRAVIQRAMQWSQFYVEKTGQYAPPNVPTTLFRPISVAPDQFCVFCHGCHLGSETKSQFEAHKKLLQHYRDALQTPHHARPEMIAMQILTTTGNQLLRELYAPTGEMTVERFSEMTLRHIQYHDHSVLALIFAMHELIGVATAFATANAYTMDTADTARIVEGLQVIANSLQNRVDVSTVREHDATTVFGECTPRFVVESRDRREESALSAHGPSRKRPRAHSEDDGTGAGTAASDSSDDADEF